VTELAQQRLAPTEAFKLAAVLLTVVTTAIAALFGGMPALLVTLAVVLAIRVYHHPGECAVAGPLFLLAANVFVPDPVRFDANNLEPIFQMYYWAAGILIITLAALPKLGARAFLQLPRSLYAFLLVLGVASVYGWAHGNAPSYVLRQLFGSLLLFAYFMLGQRSGSEQVFAEKMRAYGIPCAAAFMVYYAWVFSEYGVHKEMTTLGTQAAILGLLFAGQSGWKWWTAAALMFMIPLLLVQRRDLAMIPLGLVLMWGFRTEARALRCFLWIVAGTVVLFSLFPPFVEIALDTAMGADTIDRLLPAGARDTSSIADRALELVEAADVIKRSPVIGDGMGATIAWESVVRGDMEQAYVDNGWAYVASKMGLAGVLAFGWFVVALVRRMPGASIPISACLLSVMLVAMWAEPVFFQFSTSPFIGVMAGMLFARPRSFKQVQIA
jgi:hypothetical protein